MLSWITANLGTILVCMIVLAMITLAIAVMVRDKKKGKSACGCGCSSCPMSGKCHENAPDRRS